MNTQLFQNKFSSRVWVLLSWLAASAFSGGVYAAMFTGLGRMAPDPSYWVFPTGISADGNVVVGVGTVPSTYGYEYRGFRWTKETGLVQLPAPLNGASDVSDDGTTVVWGNYRWSLATGLLALGTYNGIPIEARRISGDGKTVIGSAGGYGVRWTKTGGAQELGYLTNSVYYTKYTYPSAVSGDASVIVGASNNGFGGQAFRWTEATGLVGLTQGPLGEPFYGAPDAISADGKTLVWPGILWREATGFKYLGTNQDAYGVTADGSVIVGGDRWTGAGIAFVWDEARGLFVLKNILETEHGLNLTGWTLNSAVVISDDGKAVAGIGINPMGYEEAWYASLDRPITALPTPIIDGFWPGNAPAGSFVFIFGQGFVPQQTKVQVNGIPASFVQVADLTLLYIMLPPGDTRGPITVTTPFGSATSSASFGGPQAGVQITGLWPSTVSPFQPVFVFGSGFVANATTATVNGIPAPVLQVLEPSLLFFMAPPTPTTGFVSVTTSAGTATSASLLTIK